MGDDARLKRDLAAALKAEQWGAALELLERWCELQPGDARGWFNRGYCLGRLGRLEEALSCLERSLELDPESSKARELRDRVRRRLDRLLASSGTGSPDPEPASAIAPAQAIGQAPPPSPPLPVAEAERDWRVGTVVGGRYEVRELRRGGMGVVYLAFDRELERMVAVKTPLPSTQASADGRRRFQREAGAWIALGMHPNICTAFYVQEIGGLPRLFIEYVDGGDLDDWLKRDGELTIARRLDIAVQIADAMDYTHGFAWSDEEGQRHRGVVHRDLKPSNVLMTAEGVARITDFGLVRAETGEPAAGPSLPEAGRDAGLTAPAGSGSGSGSWHTMTEAGGVVGTPPYMAPELWRPSQVATRASDVYAFGCILFELFCGRRPFLLDEATTAAGREAQLEQWLRVHITEPPPDPHELAHGVDPEIAQLMVDCLAKQPEARPPAFAVVAETLRAVYRRLAGEPARPRPLEASLLSDSLNNRAVSLATLGHADAAEAALRSALAVDPGHLEATFNLALHEWHARGLTDAELERRMDEAARTAPDPARVHHLRGRLWMLLDDPARAVEHLRHAAGTGSAETRRDLAVALLTLARATAKADDLAEAETILRPLAEGGDLVSLAALAAALVTRGEQEQAAAEWARALELAPDAPAQLEEALALLLPGLHPRRTVRLAAPVDALALLPGDRLVVRSGGTAISLHDLAGDQPVLSFRVPPPSRRGALLAATADRLLACTADEPVTVWELPSGRRHGQLRLHPGQVTSVALSADGRLALTGASDRRVRLWDTATGTCRLTLDGHEAFVSAVAFLPGEGAAISGSGDGAVRVWDLTTGAGRAALAGQAGPVHAVAVTGDGTRAASAGDDGTVKVWDLAAGCLQRTLTGHGAPVTGVAVSADGRRIVSVGNDTLRVWRLETGSPLEVIRFPGALRGLALAADGRRAITSQGAAVEVVDLAPEGTLRIRYALASPLAAAEAERRERAFRERLETAHQRFAGGDLEAAVGELRQARAVPGYAQHAEALELWGQAVVHLPKRGLRSVAELRTLAGHPARVSAVAFSPDCRSAVTAGADGTLRLWDLATGEALRNLVGHVQAVSAASFDEGGRLLYSAGRDGEVRVWRVDDGTCLRVLPSAGTAIVAAAPTVDGRGLLAAGEDGTVRLHLLDQSRPPRILGSHREPLAAVAASPDGRYVVSGGWDHQVMTWRLPLGTELHLLDGHSAEVTALAVSPDSRRIASGSADGTARLWDADDGRCARVLPVSGGGVTCLAFTPDGQFLIVGGRDGALSVLDLRAAAGQHTVWAHTGPVSALAASPDGRLVLSAGERGALRLWLLDWEPDLREAGADWDERARPFLDSFLRRQAGTEGRPSWTDTDLTTLMAELGRRGFGWLKPDRVRRELEAMAGDWGERRSLEEREDRLAHQRQERRQRVAPFGNLIQRLTGGLGVRLAVLLLAAVALGVAYQCLRVPTSSAIRLSGAARTPVLQGFLARADSLRTPGLARAFHARPTAGDAGPCAESEAATYLDVLVHPGAHTSALIDPTQEATDQAFCRLYRRAVACLPSLVDESGVHDLLAALAAGPHPNRAEDLLAVLVKAGDRGLPVLAEALGDGEPAVRQAAALALLYQGSPRARRVLLDAVSGDDPGAAEAAAAVLRDLVAIHALDADGAFALISRLAHTIDPLVRRHALAALVLFRETEPVGDLLDAALQDSDADVRQQAQASRDAIRQMRRHELLGR